LGPQLIRQPHQTTKGQKTKKLQLSLELFEPLIGIEPMTY
ncbi:MAG: hypothetical protein ACI9DK_001526, partial [Vicingaceae bacterium]